MQRRVFRTLPSQRVTLLIAAIHLVAAIAFLHLPLYSVVTPSALVVLALSFGAYLFRRRAHAFVLGEGGGFALLHEGREIEACLEPATVDFGFAVWLIWREPPARRRCGCMLLRADHSREDWRMLSIWLRHEAPAGWERVSDGV